MCVQGEANCDRNMETFLRCIDAVKGSTGGTGFSAVKLTALGRPEILVGGTTRPYRYFMTGRYNNQIDFFFKMRLSECIEKTRKYYTQVI